MGLAKKITIRAPEFFRYYNLEQLHVDQDDINSRIFLKPYHFSLLFSIDIHMFFPGGSRSPSVPAFNGLPLVHRNQPLMFITNVHSETLCFMQVFESVKSRRFEVKLIIDTRRSLEQHKLLYRAMRKVYVNTNDYYAHHMRHISNVLADDPTFTVSVINHAIRYCDRRGMIHEANAIREWVDRSPGYLFEIVFYKDTSEDDIKLIDNIRNYKRLGKYSFMPQVYNYLDGSLKHVNFFRLIFSNLFPKASFPLDVRLEGDVPLTIDPTVDVRFHFHSIPRRFVRNVTFILWYWFQMMIREFARRKSYVADLEHARPSLKDINDDLLQPASNRQFFRETVVSPLYTFRLASRYYNCMLGMLRSNGNPHLFVILTLDDYSERWNSLISRKGRRMDHSQ